jgi:hypothetical protein
MRTMKALRFGTLALVLALAPATTAFANGRDDRGRSGHDDHGDRDGHGDRNRGNSSNNHIEARQVVCWQGGTYTVDRDAVPLILVFGGHLGACPASPSR